MRRRLAYLFLGASLLLGVGVTITSSLSKMDTDVSYGSGKDLYFNISVKDSTYEGVNPESYIGADATTRNYDAVDAVAKEMEKRLEFWDINASVIKEGYHTVKISVRTQGSDDVEYSYLQTYLAYSGQHVTVEAGSRDEDIMAEAPNSPEFADNGLFEEGTNAQIEYVNSIPVVTIPVKETFQGENGPLNELIKYCKDNTNDAETDEDGNETVAAKSTLFCLWDHKQENDSYAIASDTNHEDFNVNMGSRLLFGQEAANSWWVDPADDDNNYKKIQLIPSSAAIKDGSYDPSKANAAFKAAKFYRDVLNASEYDYDVSFSHATVVSPSVDPLVTAGDWHLAINFGPTAIAALVALALGITALCLFYRIGAVSILANAAVATEGAILMFAYFSAQFGIGALVGFALGAMVTSFGGMYYFHKFKQQIYEGRTIKKAHQEGMKKALWPTIDVSVVSILVGIFVYAFVHSTIGNLGLALILTTAVGLVLNLILLRIQGALLANDASTEKSYGKLYGINTSVIPNSLKDEKQTYFGKFANKDFKKAKRPFLIGAIALLVAALGGIIVTNALGSVYNYSGAYDNTTSLLVEYRVDTESQGTKLLYKKDQAMDFLSTVEYKDGTLADLTSADKIVLEQSSVYLNDDETTYNVYNFEIPLSVYFADNNEKETFKVAGTTFNNLNLAIEEAAKEFGGTSIYATSATVRYQAGTPNLGTVYLGLGLGFVAAAVYMMFRFGLARGFVTGLLGLGTSVVTVGFFALTRLPVTPIASIAAVVASLAFLYFAIYLLNRGNEIVKDSRERDKSALAFRNACLEKGVGEEAGEILIFAGMLCAFLLAFVAFGPRQYWIMFVGAIIGLAIATALALFVLVPLCVTFGKWFKAAGNSISGSYKKAQEARKAANKANQRKSSEPEEAIFIGIND